MQYNGWVVMILALGTHKFKAGKKAGKSISNKGQKNLKELGDLSSQSDFFGRF
ncbi:unnamed protein product [Linum tenue]|uniref:Uncharacterized protein n=1 Tax=Linum tenue TaxID=586396 RepID=A0AAV0Q452_9ROSI|nr:unnamed protein product [Linum tenue]